MSLPIDPLLPEVVAHLRQFNTLVLEAPPGAGKTTRVPPALLQLTDREVLVLEPRRLAARLAARFVASELGERVGETVGYQVRFEEVSGPRTRLRFPTEGVLTRRLLSDPTLEYAGTVVLDEFHERHLEGDLALALLRRLQRTKRPDLRIVVMSATLDTAPVATYLGARVLRSEGRQYPLEILYTPHSAAPLEQLVANALEGELRGHALVFLPGAAEIRRVQSHLGNRGGRLVLPLHAASCRKSRTAPSRPPPRGKSFSPPTLPRVPSPSMASARSSIAASPASPATRPGPASRLCKSLASARHPLTSARAGPGAPALESLFAFIRSKILSAGRRTTLRKSHGKIFRRWRSCSVPWTQAVSQISSGWTHRRQRAVEHAEELLRQLGASGAIGKEMARYPLHPRLSRLIVEAHRRGVAEDGCTVAALLSAGERLPSQPAHATRSDLLALLESEWEPRTTQTVRQIRRIVNPPRQHHRDEDALLTTGGNAFSGARRIEFRANLEF